MHRPEEGGMAGAGRIVAPVVPVRADGDAGAARRVTMDNDME